MPVSGSSHSSSAPFSFVQASRKQKDRRFLRLSGLCAELLAGTIFTAVGLDAMILARETEKLAARFRAG